MQTLTIQIDKEHWEQIVSDIENMCGTDKEEIEILQSVVIL